MVALVIGWWETMDRMYHGTWQHLGDPDFDAYEMSQLERAVSVLGSQGAHVVLMTSPFYDTGEQPNGQPWDEDSPVRVDLLNHMIESVAALHPGIVSVVPLNQYLDPTAITRRRSTGRRCGSPTASTPPRPPAPFWRPRCSRNWPL